MKKKYIPSAHTKLIHQMQSAAPNPIKAPKKIIPNVQAGSATAGGC